MKIFEPDDPDVVSGKYDVEGYTPKERRAQQRKARAMEADTMTTTKERDQDLPGMEHRSIKALEHMAQVLVSLRAQRKALKQQEDTVADKLITLMRKHKKDHYKRDGIEIYIELSAEKVKVRMRTSEDETSSGDVDDDETAH